MFEQRREIWSLSLWANDLARDFDLVESYQTSQPSIQERFKFIASSGQESRAPIASDRELFVVRCNSGFV